MGGGGSVPPVAYLFVDAGHLRPNFSTAVGAWVGRPIELYVPSVSQYFGATKTFFYDSIDDLQGKDESSDQFEARLREQEARLRAINACQNNHVRFGSITGGDRRRRRQKEVDILIAVDMMNHAVRQNMDRAVLLTGDRDFTPLVETLVQFGLTVHVAGDRRSTSDVLQAAADSYRPLAISSYVQFVHPNEQRNLPALPSFSSGDLPAESKAEPYATGSIGSYVGKLLPRRSSGFILVMENLYNSMYTTARDLSDLQQLSLFLELEHGEVGWLRDAERRLGL